MRPRNGDWAKVSGGDFGVVFHSGRWCRFACLECARFRGLLKRKFDWGELTGYAKDRLNDPVTFPCGGASLHNAAYRKRRE